MSALIVGGGITGLSAAWFLHKQDPTLKITLFEKENRLGGWIRTSHQGGFLFEQGPHTFPFSRSPHLLSLIQALNLELIPSAATKRYILQSGRLRSLTSFLPMLLPHLFKRPPALLEDESIYSFASRHFSPKIAETLFDPLTLGIYAGDIRTLSIRRCFPTLCQGPLFKHFRPSKGLFTLKDGMEALIHALAKLPIDIHLNRPAQKIGEKEVIAQGKIWRADHVLSALPPPLPARSLWVINLGYENAPLPKKGLGYLVPTKEKESLLGVLFDSEIFPQQNKQGQTRLTAMVRAEEKEPLQAALSGLKRHLGLMVKPDYTAVLFAKDSIPQFEVGCTYPYGISVDACVERAKGLVLSCQSELAPSG